MEYNWIERGRVKGKGLCNITEMRPCMSVGSPAGRGIGLFFGVEREWNVSVHHKASPIYGHIKMCG